MTAAFLLVAVLAGSPYLNRGYGVTNEMRITRDAGRLFTLSLNNNQIMTFHDGRIPVQTGGGDG